MRRRRVALAALLLALLAGSSAYVAIGLRVYARYGSEYADYTTACDTLITWTPPTTIFAGFYPNQASLVTIRYRSPAPEATNLTVVVPGFTQSQTVNANTAQGFRTATFKPPLLSPTTLDSLIGTPRRAAQIEVRLSSGARTLCMTSAPVWLYSRQWIQWRNSATGADNTPLIAGWVTPDDPSVVELVRRAALRLSAHQENYDDLPALFGYQQGAATPEQARNQVNALFDTLQFDYHLRYAADNAPFTTSDAQQVQLPRDVLGASEPTGMCVETSVILASAVERLGMRPYIVFTATHAFVGVAMSDDPHAPIEYWETSDPNGGVTGAQANTKGDGEYAQYSADHQITEVVDIQSERARGVEPME